MTGLSQGRWCSTKHRRGRDGPKGAAAGQYTFIKARDPAHVLSRVFEPAPPFPLIDYTLPAPVKSQ